MEMMLGGCFFERVFVGGRGLGRYGKVWVGLERERVVEGS